MWTGFTKESFELLEKYKLNDNPKDTYNSIEFDKLIRSQFNLIKHIVYSNLKELLPEYNLTDKYALSKHASLGNKLYHHFWAAIYRSSKKAKSRDIQFFWRIDTNRFTFGLYIGHQVDDKIIEDIKNSIKKNSEMLRTLAKNVQNPRKLTYANDDVNGFLENYLNVDEVFSSNYWEEGKSANIYFEYSRAETISRGTKLIEDMMNGFKELSILYRLLVNVSEEMVEDENEQTGEAHTLDDEIDNQNLDRSVFGAEEKIRNFITEIEFLNDEVSQDDFIGGRKEFSRILADKISRIFKNKKHEGTFALHIEGKWGSGKSTFMHYLRKDLEDSSHWKVLEFNAWRYQHFIPTWWGFLEQIKKDLMKTNNWHQNLRLLTRVNLFRSSKMIRNPSFIIGSIFSCLTIYGIFNQDTINVSSNVKIGGFVITSAFALLILKPIKDFYSSSVFLSAKKINELLTSPTLDPFEIASEYFMTITKMNNESQYLAIFIDDLDRCKPEHAVKFLEGIQTLFKDKNRKVFYLVNADKIWLKNCFENEYKNQKNLKDNESIGYYFLEKLFQLSTRLPNSNSESDKVLIDKVSGIHSERKIIQEKIDQGYQSKESTIESFDESQIETSEEPQEKLNIIPTKEEVENEKTHLLTKYNHYLGSNPRTLKRILNSYEINRQLIALEVGRKKLSDDELEIIMRCTIMEQRWPDVMFGIENRLKITQDGSTIYFNDLKINQSLVKELEEDVYFNELLKSISANEAKLFFGIKKR